MPTVNSALLLGVKARSYVNRDEPLPNDNNVTLKSFFVTLSVTSCAETITGIAAVKNAHNRSNLFFFIGQFILIIEKFALQRYYFSTNRKKNRTFANLIYHSQWIH